MTLYGGCRLVFCSSCSLGFLEVFGITMDSVIVRHLDDRAHPADAQAHLFSLAQWPSRGRREFAGGSAHHDSLRPKQTSVISSCWLLPAENSLTALTMRSPIALEFIGALLCLTAD